MILFSEKGKNQKAFRQEGEQKAGKVRGDCPLHSPTKVWCHLQKACLFWF